MKLSEWNEILRYARECAETLRTSGFCTDIRTYTCYDNSKIVYLQLFDIEGKFYKEYSSGTHKTVLEYKTSLYHLVNRIKTEE